MGVGSFPRPWPLLRKMVRGVSHPAIWTQGAIVRATEGQIPTRLLPTEAGRKRAERVIPAR
jgi:hypothetical protein